MPDPKKDINPSLPVFSAAALDAFICSRLCQSPVLMFRFYFCVLTTVDERISRSFLLRLKAQALLRDNFFIFAEQPSVNYYPNEEEEYSDI